MLAVLWFADWNKKKSFHCLAIVQAFQELNENNLWKAFSHLAGLVWGNSLTITSWPWRLNAACLQIVVLSQIRELASTVVVKYCAVWHVVARCFFSKHTQASSLQIAFCNPIYLSPSWLYNKCKKSVVACVLARMCVYLHLLFPWVHILSVLALAKQVWDA